MCNLLLIIKLYEIDKNIIIFDTIKLKDVILIFINFKILLLSQKLLYLLVY